MFKTCSGRNFNIFVELNKLKFINNTFTKYIKESDPIIRGHMCHMHVARPNNSQWTRNTT